MLRKVLLDKTKICKYNQTTMPVGTQSAIEVSIEDKIEWYSTKAKFMSDEAFDENYTKKGGNKNE